MWDQGGGSRVVTDGVGPTASKKGIWFTTWDFYGAPPFAFWSKIWYCINTVYFSPLQVKINHVDGVTNVGSFFCLLAWLWTAVQSQLSCPCCNVLAYLPLGPVLAGFSRLTTCPHYHASAAPSSLSCHSCSASFSCLVSSVSWRIVLSSSGCSRLLSWWSSCHFFAVPGFSLQQSCAGCPVPVR